MLMTDRCELSVVVPICNEEDTLPELERRLTATLNGISPDWEMILVNDGSRDGSLALMKDMRARDPRVKVIDLSRNFGHQSAVSAGIDHARGRAVVVMDGDLQDPPELIPQLVKCWREGFDVVYAVRTERKESLPHRTAYAAFYRLLGAISDIEMPLDSGDFALMDQRVADHLASLPERNRYVRGLRAWLGFRQTGVLYVREARFAGESKYTLGRRFRAASDAIFAFSDAPLRMMRQLGLAITAVSALLGGWTLLKRLVGYEVVPGFATLALLVLFFGGVQLVTVGLLGEYIARIYAEVKGRPRYVIRELDGVEPCAEGRGVTRRER
jgi:dolichol-phosphate mannosyltransferase